MAIPTDFHTQKTALGLTQQSGAEGKSDGRRRGGAGQKMGPSAWDQVGMRPSALIPSYLGPLALGKVWPKLGTDFSTTSPSARTHPTNP